MGPIAIDIPALVTSVYSIVPEILVVATAIFVLFLDLVIPEENKRVLCGTSLVGIGIALFSVYALGAGKIEGFSGMVAHDGVGAFFDVVILAACALTLLMATGYSEWEGTHKGEFYSLILLSTSGMMFMAKGTDLMTVFLGLETLSIPIYVLVGFHRHRMSSVEGSLKYFLLGAFASGFLLYGIALMYAATG
ncbi:MAG TPA: proton-conducting transporter membrane subunit, partial [Candidatus Deferrimicrobiaceae bacterium]|nr:proton-conducting transporter membrane subunit [Candidatus Deferrimicrobiaceae bacterium]